MKCILEIKEVDSSPIDNFDTDQLRMEIDVGDPLFAYEFAVAKLWRNDWCPRSVSWVLTGPDGTILAQEDIS